MKQTTVYTVLFDTYGAGSMGDGTSTKRFASQAEADRFATGRTFYGHPATADALRVDRSVAARWGF